MLEQQSLISGSAKEAVCVVKRQLTRLLLHIIHIPSDLPSTISLLPLSLPHRRLMDCIISLILQLPGGEERAEFFSSIYVSLQSKTFHHRLRMNPFTTLKSMWSPHCEVHNQLLISIKCLISCFLVHPSSYSLLSQNCVQSPLC